MPSTIFLRARLQRRRLQVTTPSTVLSASKPLFARSMSLTFVAPKKASAHTIIVYFLVSLNLRLLQATQGYLRMEEVRNRSPERKRKHLEFSAQPASNDDSEDEEHEIENILDSRIDFDTEGNQYTSYLIRWLGWGPDWDEWVHQDDVQAEELLRDSRHQKKRRVKSPRSNNVLRVELGALWHLELPTQKMLN